MDPGEGLPANRLPVPSEHRRSHPPDIIIVIGLRGQRPAGFFRCNSACITQLTQLTQPLTRPQKHLLVIAIKRIPFLPACFSKQRIEDGPSESPRVPPSAEAHSREPERFSGAFRHSAYTVPLRDRDHQTSLAPPTASSNFTPTSSTSRPNRPSTDPARVHRSAVNDQPIFASSTSRTVARLSAPHPFAMAFPNMSWSKSTRIKVMITIDTAFFLLELVCGFLAHSLALTADAFHMVSSQPKARSRQAIKTDHETS